MKNGHRWLAFDADFAFNPHTKRIVDQFGVGGVVLWVAFLCACKRSPTPGRIRYSSDADLFSKLGVADMPEVVSVDLDAFWTLNGHRKQTRRTSHGGWTHVESTQWEDWQKNVRTDIERERKRRWRAEKARDNRGTSSGHVPSNVPLENEKEKEKIFPPTPQRGEQAPSAHASPPPTPATPKPPCAACGAPAHLEDAGANLCLRCYELGAVVVPVKRLT